MDMGFPRRPFVGQLHVYWYRVTEAERARRPPWWAPLMYPHPFPAVFEWDGISWNRLTDTDTPEVSADSESVCPSVSPAPAV